MICMYNLPDIVYNVQYGLLKNYNRKEGEIKGINNNAFASLRKKRKKGM